MLARRERLLPGWIARSFIAAIGVTVAATLPLGSSSALATSPKHVSASTLLKEACNATFAASAFRIQGHATDGKTAMSLDIYFGSAGTLINVTQHGDQTINLIVNGSSTYMKANRSFWQSVGHNSGATALAADRWFDVTSDKKDFAGLAQSFNKTGVLHDCQQRDGSAAYAGKATVNGLKAIKIRAQDGTAYIENGPTPYVLRLIASPSQKNSGDLVFSDYGVQPDTAAPPGAIPFSAFGSTGSTGNTGNTGN